MDIFVSNGGEGELWYAIDGGRDNVVGIHDPISLYIIPYVSTTRLGERDVVTVL